jgi:predicted pyridoxine 5'-phosphate oxidase superfamily flavin-nucleotide-binding protein
MGTWVAVIKTTEEPMIKITPLMKQLLDNALADGTPCLIGTASKDGRPQISPKGSVAVYGDDTLCYWERSHRTSQQRIGENPYVMVYYRNPVRKENPYRAGCIRFHGRARLVTGGPERERAWELTNHEERSKDPDKKGAAVLIDLDLVEQIDSVVIMKRN